MRPMYQLFLLCCLVCSCVTSSVGQHRCRLDHRIGRHLREGHPQGSNQHLLTSRSQGVVTIPVVVHVVWNQAAENISDEQILSQIEVLNQDFRAMNAEIPTVPAVFQERIADVEFEFCLATLDPAGAATSGITRTFTSNNVGIGGTSAIHYDNLGGQNAWDPAKYLNIWVAKFFGAAGGLSSFPGEGLPAEDGVQVDYRQFGTLNVDPPYHLGRTCTHEVGHYFNLEHVWGPSILDCCGDDFVSDTPPACSLYLNECPEHPVVSCTGPDIFMDFMFYTDDACMALFTEGQKQRMRTALDLYRPMLASAERCGISGVAEANREGTLFVSRNPVGSVISCQVQAGVVGKWEMQLTNVAGRTVFKKTVSTNVPVEVNLAGSPAGVFFLSARCGSVWLVEKIVWTGN